MIAHYNYAAPLIAVDRVVEIADREIRATKAITGNEAFFPGHYPGHPIFPGNFILEAVHQTTHYYVREGLKLSAWICLAQINTIRFFSPLQPGDCLEIVCQYPFSSHPHELAVNADCWRGERIAVARMKLLYVLEE